MYSLCTVICSTYSNLWLQLYNTDFIIQTDHLTHLTQIWEVSVDLCDWLLLGRLQTYGYQTWQGGRSRARNSAWDIGFHGNWMAATLFKKNSLKAQMLTWWCWFLACHSHLAISICLPKMDKIYQTVFEIRPIATAWQPLWRHAGRHDG